MISLTATFVKDKNDRANAVQATTLQGPDDADWDIPGGLMLRSTSGFLMPNIAGVWLTLDFAQPSSGSSVNAYAADNISLRLTRDPLIGANLIVNGDAEAEGGQERPVAGWNVPWNPLKVRKYEPGLQSGDPGLGNPGPADRGQYYLRFSVGGDPGVEKRAWQTIDIATEKYNPLIDTGKIKYEFRGWLGVYRGDPDEFRGRLTFLGQAGNSLGQTDIGPVVSGTQNEFLERTTGQQTLPAGTRRVKIELIVNKKIRASENAGTWADNVSLVLTAPDTGIKLLSVRNSGSNVAGTAVAPGEMVTLAVSGLDLQDVTRIEITPAGSVATSLGGVAVMFDTVPAPLLYVSAREIGTIVPFESDGKSQVQAQIVYKGDRSASVALNVVPTVPGIFVQDVSGTAGLIWNDDWLLNSAGNAAAKGSTVTIFWTGGGQTDPSGVTGRMETQSLPRPLAGVSVTIDGQPAEIVSVSAVPYAWAGLLMARVKVPDAAGTSGPVSVVIKAGDASSPDGAATMYVR